MAEGQYETLETVIAEFAGYDCDQSAEAARSMRTDEEILNQTNELARQFYKIHDRGGAVEKGFRFDLSEHPQEVQCWQMACIAQEMLTDTDVQVAIDNIEEGIS